ncbi:hypothetical protein PanWU01x14_077420 [Parasponia andersonii]|uniref:Uncharacterized protein n=1 Tax=Parasponia andersonii TaxID=3476 RepID=A0A2P5DBN4_PARAD|nr:hypothetical protein PanWU01x14_077420 [Parasponia andersonii]
MTTGLEVFPVGEPTCSMTLTTSIPCTTLPKHRVFPIQPRRLRRTEEELGPIGPGPSVLPHEVLVREFGPVDGLAPGSVPAVKSPPWHMNPGMTQWKLEPLKCIGFPLRPVPFSLVQSARKFSGVRGVVSA